MRKKIIDSTEFGIFHHAAKWKFVAAPTISCRNFTSCPTGRFKNPSKNGNTKEECCEASCDDVICPADMFTNRRDNIDAGQECCRKTDPNLFAFDR